MADVLYPFRRAGESYPLAVTGIGIHNKQEAVERVGAFSAQLIATEEGRGVALVNEEKYRLTAGSVLIVDQGASCSLLPDKAWTVSWITFDLRYEPFRSHVFGESGARFTKEVGDGILDEIRTIRDLLAPDRDGDGAASAALYSLLTKLSAKKETKHSDAMAAVLAYVDEHYAEELTLKTLCLVAGDLSEQYLCRLFRQTVGCRPMEYVLHRRIAEARAALERSDRPIPEIAESVGFGSTSYFYRNFKRFTGKSPLQYRQEGPDDK